MNRNHKDDGMLILCQQCGGPLLKVKDCDHAVNYLHRGTGNKATTYSTGYANCWADIAVSIDLPSFRYLTVLNDFTRVTGAVL